MIITPTVTCSHSPPLLPFCTHTCQAATPARLLHGPRPQLLATVYAFAVSPLMQMLSSVVLASLCAFSIPCKGQGVYQLLRQNVERGSRERGGQREHRRKRKKEGKYSSNVAPTGYLLVLMIAFAFPFTVQKIYVCSNCGNLGRTHAEAFFIFCCTVGGATMTSRGGGGGLKGNWLQYDIRYGLMQPQPFGMPRQPRQLPLSLPRWGELGRWQGAWHFVWCRKLMSILILAITFGAVKRVNELLPKLISSKGISYSLPISLFVSLSLSLSPLFLHYLSLFCLHLNPLLFLSITPFPSSLSLSPSNQLLFTFHSPFACCLPRASSIIHTHTCI